jgi:hypothetical protein
MMDAEATDPDLSRATSGVKSIEVFVDGARLTVDGEDQAGYLARETCDGGGCDLEYLDIPYDTREYGEGTRTITVRTTDFSANSTTETFSVGSTHQDAPCVSRPFSVYNVGQILSDLAMTEATRLCAPADPGAPELGRQDDVTYLYGECSDLPGPPSAPQEGGCLPPIEVQSSPLCQKHYNLYQNDLAPWAYELLEVKGVPAASFDEGRILEIYTGVTTVTVYGRDASLVRLFADSLKLALGVDVPLIGQTILELSQASALQPVLATLPPPDPVTLQQTTPCE